MATASPQYPTVNTEDAIELVAQDILFKLYERGRGQLDAAIEKAYAEHFGVQIKVVCPERVSATHLRGAPGNGKTTVFREAAKLVAQWLGLEFTPAEKIGIDDVPTSRQLVFYVHELGGSVSNVDFGGIPQKHRLQMQDGSQGEEFMVKLPHIMFAKMKYAGVGILLLDDFANASEAVQNVALSIVEEGRFQGLDLGRVYVGVTSNLGAALDQTNTGRVSSAIISRMKTFACEDTVERWIARIQRRYNDALGDGGIAGFLRSSPEHFSTLPKLRESPFPCPRTWEKLVNVMRVEVAKSQVRGDEPNLRKIECLAWSLVGVEVGSAVASYYYSLMTNAEPLAREYIETGKFTKASKQMFASRYAEGHSADNQSFGYQFGISISDHAVAKVAASPDDKAALERYMGRYGAALQLLADDLFSHSVSYLSGKLANTVDTFSVADGSGRKILREDVAKSIIYAMSKNNPMTEEQAERVAAALTHYESVRNAPSL